jgi:hypothetical protein
VRFKVSDANQRTGPFNIQNPVASLVSPELTSSAQKQFLGRAFLPPMAQRARNSNDTGHLRDFSGPGIMQTPAKERGDDAKRTAGGTILRNRRTSEFDPRELDGVRIDVKTSPSDVRSSPDLSVPLLSSHPGIFSPPALGRRQSTAVATQTTVMSTSERRKGDAENPATNRLTEMERALELLSSAFADAQSQAPEERAKTRDAALSAYHLNEMHSHAANQSVYTVQTVSQDSTMTSPYLMSPELGEDDRGKDPRAADEEGGMALSAFAATHEQQKRSPIFSMRSRIEQRTSEAVSKWTRKSPPEVIRARGEASSMSVNPERIQSSIPPARRSPMPVAHIELPAEHTMRFAVPSNVLQPRSPSSLLRSSPTHGYSGRPHQPTATPPKFVYEAGGDYALRVTMENVHPANKKSHGKAGFIWTSHFSNKTPSRSAKDLYADRLRISLQSDPVLTTRVGRDDDGVQDGALAMIQSCGPCSWRAIAEAKGGANAKSRRQSSTLQQPHSTGLQLPKKTTESSPSRQPFAFAMLARPEKA